jgi:hypothetical protein
MKSSPRGVDERLQTHPSLRERFEEILAIVEAEVGTLDRADAVEQRVIEELRRLGQAVLQDWATHQVERQVEVVCRGGAAVRHGQKNCTGIRPLG